IILEVVVAIGKSIWEALKSIFTFGIFHDGGVIGGNYEDVPIIAQSGEGVLSREGMRALGGAKMLNDLNSGRNPFVDIDKFNKAKKFHNGGVVQGTRSFRYVPVRSEPQRSSPGSYSDNRSVQLNVTVNGKMTEQEIDQMVDRATSRIDGNLARSAKDRK